MSLPTKEFSSVSNLTNGLDAIAPNMDQIQLIKLPKPLKNDNGKLLKSCIGKSVSQTVWPCVALQYI